MIYFITFCLVIFITGSFCGEDCNDDTKMGFSILFCDEATHCSNETAEEFLDKFRHCIAKSSEEAKQMIESGNKLEPDECVKEVGASVCKIVQDIHDNTDKYGECMVMYQDAAAALHSCLSTDDKLSAGLEHMAKIICADESKIECKLNEEKEAFHTIKNCMIETNADLKEVKNKGDIHECKLNAKEHLIKAVQENTFMDMAKCMEAKKELIEKNDPIEKCTGFE